MTEVVLSYQGIFKTGLCFYFDNCKAKVALKYKYIYFLKGMKEGHH